MSTPLLSSTGAAAASHSRSPAKTVSIDITGSPAKETLTGRSSPTAGATDHLPPPTFDLEEADEKASWAEKHLARPFQAKIVTPMIAILKSGATPEGIALSLAFGLTGGLFPVPATTTVICLLFVFLFKLNVAAVQLTNLLMTPLNIGTFMTFIRYGEQLFGAAPVALSLEPFKADPLGALATFWVSLCYGVVAWLIFLGPATFIAYQALKPLLRKAMASLFAKPD